ncbi:hypothetical protein AVEN_160884-1 [Araneus ventricosus]|uniref:Uncharacterized protein n=1 Tax=Araneus ventricosus TaxID=182803 RepID=A0A4Y2VF82_ARAVE|nr:hypothetical protein AVEN_160884-1 [Araneus ventricosus]
MGSLLDEILIRIIQKLVHRYTFQQSVVRCSRDSYRSFPSNVKLGSHHRSVPNHLESFLVGWFYFQLIKFGGSFTGWTAPTAPTGNPTP